MRLPRWRCAPRPPVTSRWAWARRSRPSAGRGPLRGWLLAAALADCCDVITIARSKSASTAVRTVTALVSALSAGTQIALARRLSGFAGGGRADGRWS